MSLLEFERVDVAGDQSLASVVFRQALIDAGEGLAEHGVEFCQGNVSGDALGPAFASVVFHFAGPEHPHGDLVLVLHRNVDSYHAGRSGAASATAATPGVRGLVEQALFQLPLEILGSDRGTGERTED